MGFKVPDDLAEKDLTLTEVRRILDGRKQMNRVQARLDGLPKQAEKYRAEIAALEQAEVDALALASKRRAADKAREESAKQGQGQE